MSSQPLIETPEQIRLRSAIQRTITESAPHVAMTMIHLLQGLEALHQRVQRMEQHLPGMASTIGAVLQMLPRYQCPKGHQSLAETTPYWRGIECSEKGEDGHACGMLAVLQNEASPSTNDNKQLHPKVINEREPQTD